MLVPITRSEMYLATAAGDADAPDTLPTPIARGDIYLYNLCARISELAAQSSDISPEDIQTAVTDYLEEHGVVFNTSAEITEVLHG